MSYDVDRLRAAFPSLRSGIAHFDGPGGTQTPRVVGEAIADVLTGPLSNRGDGALSERNADAVVAGFRSAAADLLGASADGIVYGRSATQLAYDFSRHLSKDWGPGDEVVVTRLDHDSNIRPWVQAAERVGATVRWVDFDPTTSELDLESADAAIGERTRLVALTAASNLLGTRPPVRRVADRAHGVGALVYVDGVHNTAHVPVDVGALGADFYACSPYKFLGPHCGILAADPALLDRIEPDKLLPSTRRVPERFEFGTLPYETLAGVTAAIEFLAAIADGAAADGAAADGSGAESSGRRGDAASGSRRDRLAASFSATDEHETALRRRVETGLTGLGDRVTLWSRAGERTPTLLITIDGVEETAAYRFLLERDVLAPADNFYALEASRRLGLGDAGGLRVGLAPYSTESEVDRLLDGLSDFLR